MVLDSGKIVRSLKRIRNLDLVDTLRLIQVEFDHPKELLENKDGFFRALVDGSEDKDALYAMAEGFTSGNSAIVDDPL